MTDYVKKSGEAIDAETFERLRAKHAAEGEIVVETIGEIATDTPQVGRVGDWMQTYSGRAFYIVDPRPEDVDARDIAHHLSLENRYCGASPFPWSVAQHSILVARRAVALLHRRVEDSMEFVWDVTALGLLHDSAEAYVKDIHRPLKRSLREYKTIEQCVLACILDHFFGAKSFPAFMWDLVEEADVDVLSYEQKVMLPVTPHAWDVRVTSREFDPEMASEVREQDWRRVRSLYSLQLARAIAGVNGGAK